MDTIALVDDQIADGRKLLDRLVRDGFDVTAAAWIKYADAETDPRYFYVVSRTVDQEGVPAAYRAVHRAIQLIPAPWGPWISLSELRLVGLKDRVAELIRALREQKEASEPVRLRDTLLGNAPTEEIYVYPKVVLPKNAPVQGPRLRLTRDVKPTFRFDELNEPLTKDERHAREQLIEQGMNPGEADYWVRKRRESSVPRPPIRAGTVVRSRVAAWWGEEPSEDPNPLLEVEAPDGRRALVFKKDTEPVSEDEAAGQPSAPQTAAASGQHPGVPAETPREAGES